MKLAFDLYEPNVSEICTHPIVLLHSIMETKKTWKPIAQPLADLTGRKVYAYDARSHGESPWIGEYNIDVLVDDLDTFLRDHSISKVILVGHSLGGKVAMSFTLKRPERVESLIVEDIPVRNFKHRLHNLVPFAVKMVKQFSKEFKGITDRDRAERYMRQLGHRFADFLVATPETVESYDIDYLPVKWNGNFYQLEVNIDAVADALHRNKHQPGEITGQFTGDALFILGGASQFKADQDPSIEKFFPRATRVIFKDAGHFIHQTFPKEYLTEVANFINKDKSIRARY